MDKNQKSDERFDQSMSSSSRRVMWKLSEEDMEETFDSVVTYRRSPGRCIHPSSNQQNRKLLFKEPTLKINQPSSTSLPEVKEPKSFSKRSVPGRDVASEEEEEEKDNRLSVKPSLALRYRPSYESLKYKRSKDFGSDRIPSTSRGSTSSKVVSDLKVESFTLPPQQSCVVREEAPKFAQGLSVENDSDSCCSGELEAPKNSPMLDSNPPQRMQNDLVSVHISAPTTSSLSETTRRDGTSPSKRRSTTGKVAAGTKAGSPTAADGKKCPSTSSGSTGPHLPNFRQRQQELHRYRILVEQRRLDLLELKIAREREDALHSTILFHKKMQIKECKIKAYEDNDCSDV
ncbi:uncharacterized protein LOC110188300 [Drosophila serrata]|uniref:uncharacterized protein LOC110188300 n=1 Tax=Drosophila serrata TaxID=7274 RepID=UPI000A1D0FBE|nr:uncharacterized protein LOC110188300 [Drosophila serrata]